MILFLIMLVTLVFLMGFITLVVGAGGAIFIIIFADVIVCILIIAWVMKKLTKRK